MSPRNNTGLGPVVTNENENLVPGNLDFFKSGVKADGVDRFLYQILQPVSTLTNDGPMEFRVISSHNECVVPSFIKLGGEIKIVKENGTDNTTVDTSSVVNLPIDSLFSYITVELNNEQLEHTSFLYPYKAFFEKTLSYSKAAKDTHMTNSLYYADTPGKFNIAATNAGNSGLDERAKHFSKSSSVHFHIPLALDIATLTKPLPPSTTLKFTFHRQKDDFTLMGESTHKIEIKKLYMEIGKIILSDEVSSAVSKRFLSNPFIYDFTHTRILKYTIPAGIHDGSRYAIFNNVSLPRFILIGIVRQAALNGARVKNPFHFEHFNISELYLSHNNQPIPSTPFRPDFAKKNFQRMYSHFFDNLGIYHGDCGNEITQEAFSKGLSLFPFDLTPDKCNGVHVHKTTMEGEISINLQFREATPETLTLLVYSVFETSFEVNNDEGVIVNYLL